MSVAAWAGSGAMALTGRPDGPPLPPPGQLPDRLDALVAAIAEASDVKLDWPDLVAGRAAMLGLRRQGRVSANGSCRLVRTLDGWAAVNLARPDDQAAVGALTGREVIGDPWPHIEEVAAESEAADLVADARLLGMPAAVLTRPQPVEVWKGESLWKPGPRRSVSGLRVIDLSAMWAGPLTARILAAAGAEVVKVEGDARPDGSRSTPAFYEWIHPAGQETVTVDFAHADGHKRLRELLAGADVVIEASRPRVLEQVGADPSAVAPREGRVWLSITGYGRGLDDRDWVAFGDDAAVAGGLVAWEGQGNPVFCGDAIADPLSGLAGALAVMQAVGDGGGQLIDLSMARCAAAFAEGDGWGVQAGGPRARPADDGTWQIDVGGAIVPVRAPTWPKPIS